MKSSAKADAPVEVLAATPPEPTNSMQPPEPREPTTDADAAGKVAPQKQRSPQNSKRSLPQDNEEKTTASTAAQNAEVIEIRFTPKPKPGPTVGRDLGLQKSESDAVTTVVPEDPEANNSSSAEVDGGEKQKSAPPSTPDEKKTRPTRGHQQRTGQLRKQRERKGSIPVSRKYRVDTPGGESSETPEQPNKNAAGSKIKGNSPKGGRRHRIDSGEALEATLETANNRVRTHERSRRRYIDEPHDTAVRGPHFEVSPPKRSNLTSATGQFLAYLGVLGLTIGTAIVIYGHFGGYSQYTPTGWLVTTVAQMMLFLGVINLVSGGIEQTNDDVSARINTLGEQLLRIEQVTEEALRGPKISPRRYADPDSHVEEAQRETANVRDD